MADVDAVEVPDREDRSPERLADRRASCHGAQCWTPAVRIISRLFLASYLRLFVTILLGSILAIIVIEILLEFDEIVESRTAAGGVALAVFSPWLLLAAFGGFAAWRLGRVAA